MTLKKYIRNKIILFSCFLALGMLFFISRPSNAAHQNAFICCLIDDMSFSYKTVVFYTGEEIEAQRLARFYEHNHFIDDSASGRLDVYNYKGKVSADSNKAITDSKSTASGFEAATGSTGRISINYMTSASKDVYTPIKKYIKANGAEFYSVDEELYTLALTFPSDVSMDAGSADINRAYQIAETLGEGFNNALLFINNGESYISTNQLIDAAYGLCSIRSGGTLKGPSNTADSGTSFSVTYSNDPALKDSSYQYNCIISAIDQSRNYQNMYAPKTNKYTSEDPSEEVIGRGSFPWKIKKGYKGCKADDVMEDGSHNQIAETYGGADDTTYISWEHLFVEAGTLYSQGITYANQADLYSMEALEGSVVSFFRNLLSGLTGYIDTYSMEDLIFNNGVRGSSAFYFGTFNKNWSTILLNMFLIFSAIAVSLVFFIIVRMIVKKNISTANVVERVSLMEEMKNLLISLFFISFAWGAIRVLMLLNYHFVGIWGAFADGRSLSTIHSSSVLFSGVVIQFVYFILEIYVNYVYIVRGLVIAALTITSPLFIIAFNFGRFGKAMTSAFLKELVGSIFLQSFHAFIYGMLLAAATGTRGIESIVIVASVIPLTSVFKEVTSSGGDAILKTAQSLTQTTAAVGGAAVGTAAATAGEGVSKVGETVGGAVEAAHPVAGAAIKGVTGIAGGALEASGGAFQIGTGAGLDISGVGGGGGLIKSGFKETERGSKVATTSAINSGFSAARSIGSVISQSKEEGLRQPLTSRDINSSFGAVDQARLGDFKETQGTVAHEDSGKAAIPFVNRDYFTAPVGTTGTEEQENTRNAIKEYRMAVKDDNYNHNDNQVRAFKSKYGNVDDINIYHTKIEGKDVEAISFRKTFPQSVIDDKNMTSSKKDNA